MKQGKQDHEKIRAVRHDVALELFYDRRRSGEWGSLCEGTLFNEHECSDHHDLNEVLYPRGRFQKMRLESRLQFYHRVNCAVNCRTFHKEYGHSTAYRAWHLKRMIQIYGREEVELWNDSLPLKVGKVALPESQGAEHDNDKESSR